MRGPVRDRQVRTARAVVDAQEVVDIVALTGEEPGLADQAAQALAEEALSVSPRVTSCRRYILIAIMRWTAA